MHLDIKPENVLLRKANTLSTACLGNFGLALPLVADDDARGKGTGRGGAEYKVLKECTGQGTPGYCTLEVETEGIPSMAVDTWSLGAMLLEMLTGQLSSVALDGSAIALSQWWSNPHPNHLEDDLCNSVRDWKWLDQMAQDVLLAMLCPRPSCLPFGLAP
ncbi:hypothetical protein L7F22_008931 [Adiantum nelumboides]|nr:hypothetical protein [Adiantum nelumboides]